jgi:hypothetical protein
VINLLSDQSAEALPPPSRSFLSNAAFHGPAAAAAAAAAALTPICPVAADGASAVVLLTPLVNRLR